MIEAGLSVIQLLMKWNLLLIAAGFVAVAISRWQMRTRKISFRSLQTVHRFAILAVFISPVTAQLTSALFPPQNVFRPAIQIAAEPLEERTSLRLSQTPRVSVLLSETASEVEPAPAWMYGAMASLLALTIANALRRLTILARDRKRLCEVVRCSFLFRRVGRVKIAVHEGTRVPFTTRSNGDAIVILPQSLLANWSSLRLVIRHELQHHRQKDLHWNWLLEGTRVLAGWNPLVRLWLDRIEECDELACDEALLGRRSIDSMAYATCLYEVAKAATTTGAASRLAGTAGMAVSPQFLRRRIEMTFHQRTYRSRLPGAILAGFVVLTTTLAAWAGTGAVNDRRITEQAALELAKKTETQTGIPIVINKRVLYWLNESTRTSRHRFWMRNALKRMRTYQPMIERKLAAGRLSTDLLTIPLLETGYQNFETKTAAGIWSFIPQTARKYGLKVNDDIDERIDAAKETEAAVAYLSDLYTLFGDWHLALLGYNAGEGNVQKIIAKAGHRDVFKLADEGLLPTKENRDYVPKILAGLLIMNNPELVKD